ncbi:MAG: GTP-binding protein [Pseudomonadota bacterium]
MTTEVNGNYRKLAVIGQLGCGKTELVNTLSEISPFNTDVESSVNIGKEMTTVGIDYGRVAVGEKVALGVYGVPGQKRYSFIWEMVKEGLWAVVVLVRYQDDPDYQNFNEWLDFFQVRERETPCIVGISHSEGVEQEGLVEMMETLQTKLAEQGIMAPVLPVDNRDREQALTLLNTLNAMAVTA